MTMSTIDPNIIAKMSFEIFVPIDPATCFDNIENIQTRNWAVPGETLNFFIKASPSIMQLDSFSFSAYVVEKPIRTRRSTLMHPIQMNSTAKYVDPTATICHSSFPSIRPFRLPNGYAIYPLTVQIPVNHTSPFFIDVYIPKKTTPIARTEIRPILPFYVSWEQHTTAVSYVAQFGIQAVLKGTKFNSVTIESTDISFDTRPPHNEKDFQANIAVTRATELKCSLQDEESVSAVFLLRSLTEVGASLLSDIFLQFYIIWKYENLSFTTQWAAELHTPSLGLAMLLPPATVHYMQTSTIPLRITNLKETTRNIELAFEGGTIQPIAQRIKVPELESGASRTVNISLLPLTIGVHKLKFWAVEGDQKIEPMFPTYITVVE